MFDRADHDVDGVVLHVHPSQVARLVLVGEERFSAQLEVPLELGVLGQLGRGAELLGGELVLLGVGFAVRDRHQVAVAVAAHHGVFTAELRIRFGRRLELFLGHVGGIEGGSQGLVADPLHEGSLALQAVPRTVVDLGEALEVGDR